MRLLLGGVGLKGKRRSILRWRDIVDSCGYYFGGVFIKIECIQLFLMSLW